MNLHPQRKWSTWRCVHGPLLSSEAALQVATEVGSPTSGSGAAKAWMSDALVNARWKPEADVLAAVRRVAQWK